MKTRVVPASEIASHPHQSLRAQDYMEKPMEKYGVDEKNNEDMDKKAAEGCPKCGSKLVAHGNVMLCPKCGSEPFEEKK